MHERGDPFLFFSLRHTVRVTRTIYERGTFLFRMLIFRYRTWNHCLRTGKRAPSLFNLLSPYRQTICEATLLCTKSDAEVIYVIAHYFAARGMTAALQGSYVAVLRWFYATVVVPLCVVKRRLCLHVSVELRTRHMCQQLFPRLSRTRVCVVYMHQQRSSQPLPKTADAKVPIVLL